MEITGEIIFKGQVQVISEKFRKLDFVVKTDAQYPQEILVQVVQDKCEIMTNYQVGSQVKCHINIRGRSNVGTDGIKKWFNNIDVWKIEPVGVSSNNGSNNYAPAQPTTPKQEDLPF